MVSPCVLTIKRRNLWKSRRLTQSCQEVASACYSVRKKRGTFEQWWKEKKKWKKMKELGRSGEGCVWWGWNDYMIRSLVIDRRLQVALGRPLLCANLMVLTSSSSACHGFHNWAFPLSVCLCVCVRGGGGGGRGDYWLFWVRPSTSRPVCSPLRPWPQ